MRIAQRIKKTTPEFFQITILLINRQSSYKNEFLEVYKNSEYTPWFFSQRLLQSTGFTHP